MQYLKYLLAVFLAVIFATTANAAEIEPGETSEVEFKAAGMQSVTLTPTAATFTTETYDRDLLDSDYVLSHNLPTELRDNNLNTTVTYNLNTTTTYTIDFTKSMSLQKMFVSGIYQGTFTYGKFELTAYDKNNQKIGEFIRNVRDFMNSTTGPSSNYVNLGMENVKKITIKINIENGNYKGVLGEIGFFGEPFIEYFSVSDLKVTDIKMDSFVVTYKNPADHEQFESTDVRINGVTRKEKTLETSHTITGLKPNTTYKVEVITNYTSGRKVTATIDVTTLDDTRPPVDVSDLTGTYSKQKGVIDLSYKINDRTEYVKIYRDNELIADNLTDSSYVDKDISRNKTYVYRVVAVNKHAAARGASITVKTTADPPANVTDLAASIVNDKIVLTYVIGADAEYVDIYRNSRLYAEKVAVGTFEDEDVKQGSNYTYRVVSVHSENGKSSGVSVAVKVPTKEVTSLRATPQDYRVDLSWKLPSYEDFHHVKIYRADPAPPAGLMQRVMSLFAADDKNYSPIFETNGTYLNDLTVQPDTKYTYKLTTVDTSDNETPGVTIDVTTKKTAVTGGKVEGEDPYIVKWSTPEKGKIKVMVGGVEYATVNAADKQIAIPKANMKYDAVGNPDVQLIPVAENGKEGVVTTPGGSGTLDGTGIDVPSLLKISMGLFGLVAFLVLFALSFRVTPKLIVMIREAFTARKSKNMDIGGRRS